MTKMTDLVRNGYIGKVKRMVASVPQEQPGFPQDISPMPVPANLDYDRWLGPARLCEYTKERVHPMNDFGGRPGWMRILDYCEGMISNWGTHLLDVAQLINGTERTGPVSVEGTGRFPAAESKLWTKLLDHKAQFRYANGVTIDYKMDQPYLRVEGEEGWLQAPFGGPSNFTASDPALLRIKFKDTDIRVPNRQDKADWIQGITKGTPVMIDAEIGHRCCSLGQIAHIAIQRGKRLDWDLDTERFPNHGEANGLLAGTYRAPYRLG